jgi:hypothetical protein
MALGSTHPLTEMSMRMFPEGKGGRGWQPYHLHVPNVLKSGSLNLLESLRPVQACNGIALALLYNVYLLLGHLVYTLPVLVFWNICIINLPADSTLQKNCITWVKINILRMELEFTTF